MSSYSATAYPTTTASTTSPPPSPPPEQFDSKRGLSLKATLGIGLGMAIVCILIFAVIFQLIRRRRRKWGAKRKAQGEKDGTGDTPDEEITKKVTSGGDPGVAELDDEEMQRVELAGGGGDEKDKKAMRMVEDVGELDGGNQAMELPTAREPVEIGDTGQTFIAELDGTEIWRRQTLKKLKEEREAKSGSVKITKKGAEKVAEKDKDKKN